MSICQQAFNSTELTSQDDFFDIGGDSLLALQITTELKKYYNVNIPLYYLFEYPTVSLLSLKLSELVLVKENSTQIFMQKISKSIIQLSRSNHPIPLFLVHPVGGSVFWYKQLAKELDGQYTIYGIQDASIDGESIRFSSIEDMASHYLQEIASVYKGDCYCLGGASFGSTVAFELARQLENANKKVVFLGLFDGWATYPDELIKDDTSALLSRHDENDGNDEEGRSYLNELEKYRKNLLLAYQLPMLSMNITLFKATQLWEIFIDINEPDNGWHAYTEGKISVRNIPGTHETIFFQPYVQILANQLKQELSKVGQICHIAHPEVLLD